MTVCSHCLVLFVADAILKGEQNRKGVMKKFIVLYLSPVSAREQIERATPEQMRAGMAEWMKWREKAGNAIVDLGAPLANGKQLSNREMYPPLS